MAQRVAIARALISDPPIMLMDEPFGALDEITRDRLNVELHELWRSTNKAILFVTHSIPEAVLLSTQVVIMGQHPGKIVEVVKIDLPEVRHADIANTPEFFEHVTHVRSGLLKAMDMALQ
jgi:NitT/TauT family transport system ATP-binding protein